MLLLDRIDGLSDTTKQNIGGLDGLRSIIARTPANERYFSGYCFQGMNFETMLSVLLPDPHYAAVDIHFLKVIVIPDVENRN